MFERIIVRRHDAGSDAIDIGRLAETLLFYDDVHLLIDGSGLSSILQKIGADALLELIVQKRITVTFVVDFLGTHNQTFPLGPTLHSFVAARLTAHEDGRRLKRKDLITETFERVLGHSKQTRGKCERFLRHVKFQEYVSNDPAKRSDFDVTAQAYADLDNPNYAREVVFEAITSQIPDFAFPRSWHFQTTKNTRGFTIESNLDLNAVNRAYQQRTGEKADFTLPGLICHVLDVRGDLHFASHYMAEMAIDPLRSKLIQLKFLDFVRRRLASQGEIEVFQDVHLQSSVAIREAINSGARSFKEFMTLLKRADKFKGWLKETNPDAKLIDEYFQAATRETWAEKLPTKSTRFVVFSSLGIGLDFLLPTGGVGTALGVGTGAVDTFWLDRLIKGWRPNHFVSGPLKRFVDD